MTSRRQGRSCAARRALARARGVALAAGLVWAVGAGPGAAQQPVDLSDRSTRWIEVRFEVSPEDEPGGLDRLWSAPRRARLEPTETGGLVRIRIPAQEVEAHLRSTGTETVEGSFSDFLWTLDPASGHVLDAQLSGRVRERVVLGPFRTAATVRIDVAMTTRAAAGFRSTDGLLGIRTHHYCRPEGAGAGEPGCVAVAPVVYDPSRGYVNAVGALHAAHPVAEIRAFSPLGEVRFSERATEPGGTPDPAESAGAVVSGPPATNALCSPAFDPACRARHGGES